MGSKDIGGAIGKLYQVFTTFFSMRDLESEFTAPVRIEVFGDGHFADNFAKKLYPKSEQYINSIEDEISISKIESSTFALFFPNPSCLKEPEFTDLIAKIPPHSRRKAIFLIPQLLPEEVKSNVDRLLESMAMCKSIVFSKEDDILKKIILKIGNKAFSAARIYPGLRDTLTAIQIGKISRENASIAFISSIPASIPVIGTIIALFAVAGETLILTANQVRLCLRIAGIYGYKLAFYERMAELWPVLAGALGWKALARAAVGLLPAAGAAVKASIAYAGTATAGKCAQIYYKDGKPLTKNNIKLIYENSKKSFSENTGKILNRIKRRKVTEEQVRGLIEQHSEEQAE